MFCSGRLSDAFHHLSRSGHSAEPSIDAAENDEHILGLAGCASAGIENLVCVDSLHERKVESLRPQLYSLSMLATLLVRPQQLLNKA